MVLDIESQKMKAGSATMSKVSEGEIVCGKEKMGGACRDEYEECAWVPAVTNSGYGTI